MFRSDETPTFAFNTKINPLPPSQQTPVTTLRYHNTSDGALSFYGSNPARGINICLLHNNGARLGAPKLRDMRMDKSYMQIRGGLKT